MEEPALTKRAVLWLHNGVLTQRRGASGALVYAIADALPTDAGGGAGGGAGAAGEEEARGGASMMASSEEQEAAGMRVYEQYVMGMLTNFDALPLERIHNMLKMFVADPPYDKTAAQLERFLARLVAEQKLSVDRGSYSRRGK